MYRTATNLGIDALRASGRRQHEEAAGRLVEERATASPLNELLREEKCRRVRAAPDIPFLVPNRGLPT